MKILVIWEEIPENTSLYLLENVDAKSLAKLKGAHGRFLNFDEYEDTWLCDTLEGKKPLPLVKGKPFDAKGIDLIVVSGIGL